MMDPNVAEADIIPLSVAVLMSGGVDSSVAAALLVEEGCRVVGFTLKLWDAEDEEHARKVCCTSVMARDAGRVCSILGIPHYTLDLREDFQREVIDRFERDYLAGRTPNPCVHCNSRVKWGKVWDKVKAIGMQRIATGHYAQLTREEDGETTLRQGRDKQKDQSYFLWEIPRDLLSKTLLPLGLKTKEEVREIARRMNLPVAEKEESQEICFIPRDDYRGWLRSRHPELQEGEFSGEMVDESGKVIGRHDGYPFFTVGQRKGLGLGGGRKLFVTQIDAAQRTVRVGPEEGLTRGEFEIEGLNLLSSQYKFAGENGYRVKIRYRDAGQEARLVRTSDDRITIKTREPVRSLTPGQSAVIYHGDRVVAGGIIR